MDTATPSSAPGFELRFVSLFGDGRGFSFPCDAAGRIDPDRLGDRARDSYDHVCGAIGRDVASCACTSRRATDRGSAS